MHEASQWKVNSFLTLTYRDRSECSPEQKREHLHLPADGSLVKSHHQKFIKRLREHLHEPGLKYYHCGEYGDDNNRPHYHTCLFNLCFNDEKLYSKNDGYTLWTSQTLEKLWSYGFATIGNLTFESASYVAGYILKKITGARADDHYLRYNEQGKEYWLQPEYTTMSTGYKRGNGIGASWLKQFHQDVFPSNELPIPGVGIKRGIPRYYETLMEDINPNALEEAKALREQFAKSHPEAYTDKRLEDKYKIYKANIAHKRRQL